MSMFTDTDSKFAPVVGEMALESIIYPAADTSAAFDDDLDILVSARKGVRVLTFVVPENTAEIFGCDFYELFYLQAMRMEATTPPTQVSISVEPGSTGGHSSREYLDEIQKLAALTLEEIAPLLSVSRRSLQNWRSGSPISARKDLRLRALRDAIRNISGGTPTETRNFIFEKPQGRIRVYDLLAEGRFEAVLALAGKGTYKPDNVDAEKLLARLDLLDEGKLESTGGRLNKSLSRRLKRQRTFESKRA